MPCQHAVQYTGTIPLVAFNARAVYNHYYLPDLMTDSGFATVRRVK